MTVSKASLSQHIDTAKQYAKPAAEAALVIDGTIRIWKAFQQTRAGVQLPAAHANPTTNATDAASAELKSVKNAKASKRNWDILARFGLTPVQNVIVGATEIAAAVYLYRK